MLSIYNSSIQTDAPAPVAPSSSYKILLRDQIHTSDFFDFPATILIIEDYFEAIPTEIYSSNAGTISNVEFFKMTTISNIEGVLTNFPNLQFIKFTNLSLDQYYQVNAKQLSTVEYSACHLLQVTFSHFGGLTIDEMIILDFFTQMISCISLASLHFNQKNSFRFEGPLPTLQHNEVIHEYGVELGPWTICNFLNKYSKTIKSLKIERHEFYLFPTMGAMEPIARLSASLQLRQLFFLVDTYGIETMLPFQNEVEQLSCKWHTCCEVIPWRVSNMLLAVAACCRSNSKLVNVEVPGCIEVDTEKYPNFQSGPGPDWIDLKNFQECSSLTNLYAEEACQFKATEQQFLGTFINSQFLPTTIRSLRIVVGRVLEEEFRLLTSHFQNLNHLDSFLLRSGTKFSIDQTSFGNMLKIPKTSVNSIVICNGNFSSDFQPHNIIMCASQGRETFWKLIVSDKWLSLRKDKLAYSFVA